MRFFRPVTALLSLLACSMAYGAIVVRVEVEDLTDTATVVIRGRVLESKARWTDDHTTIHTYVRIAVDEVLKGSAGAEVLVTCFGGSVGEDRVAVRGVPEFEKGETVVVFLWKNKRGDLIPLGMNQGKFHVEKDPATGRLVARNSLKGLALVSLHPGTKVRRRPDVLPLDTLRDRVRKRLARVEAAERKDAAPEKTPAKESGKKTGKPEAPEKSGTAKPGSAKPGSPLAAPSPEKTENPKTEPSGGKSPGAGAGEKGKKPPEAEKPPERPEKEPEKN